MGKRGFWIAFRLAMDRVLARSGYEMDGTTNVPYAILFCCVERVDLNIAVFKLFYLETYCLTTSVLLSTMLRWYLSVW